MLIVLFLVSLSHFNFLFVPCGGLSWLPVSFLLRIKYTLSYRIVSYGPSKVGSQLFATTLANCDGLYKMSASN